MSSEENSICEKCKVQTDEILSLPCKHNYCLSCAAKILKAQHKTNYFTNQIIKCDKCQSICELKGETIKEILENEKEILNENIMSNYMNKNKNENIDMNNNINENDYVNLEEEDNNDNNAENNQSPNKKSRIIKNLNINNNVSTSELNIINELNSNNIRPLCKEHSEPLTYLCLDCMTNCICTECVVHGIHKNHEVLNIKKAYPLIFKKLEDLSNYANDQKKSIFLVNEAISKKKNLINTLIDRSKNEIHNTFEQIKLRLDNKEKEIINNSTNILHKNIEELNKFDNVLKQNTDSLEELIGKINIILNKKDELNTINYFCENKNKILKQCELNEINNIPDLDSFTNFKIEPNRITLNNMLEGINKFNFVVTNIKGFEANNYQNKKIMKNIPKKRFKYSNNNIAYNNIMNNDMMNDNINQFNNINENINNYSMFNNMPNRNFSNTYLNSMQSNNNMKNKRPKTAKSHNRRRKINNLAQINNMQKYPININQKIEDIQNDLNKNLDNFKKDLNRNIENFDEINNVI